MSWSLNSVEGVIYRIIVHLEKVIGLSVCSLNSFKAVIYAQDYIGEYSRGY